MHHPEYLFVYGTLLSGIPASMGKFLRRRAELVGPATAPGQLYDIGLYPGWVPGSGVVRGELYRIDPAQATETWNMLDTYESVTGSPGDEYRRATVKCQPKRGETIKATTYEFIGKTRGKYLIPDGNYPPYHRSNPAHRKFTGG